MNPTFDLERPAALVALSADSETLAYLGFSGILRVVNTLNGAPIYEPFLVDAQLSKTTQLRVSNGGHVVSFLTEGRPQVVNVLEGTQEEVRLTGKQLALSDDGRYLAVKTPERSVHLVHTRSMNQLLLVSGSGFLADSGPLTFVPGSVRALLDTPNGKEQDRRLHFLEIHRAEAVSGTTGEMLGTQEITRRSATQYLIPYPSRALEISGNRHQALTLGHSVVEVWNAKEPHAPFSLGVPAAPRSRTRFQPIETATLSPHALVATVYANGTLVMDAQTGEEVARFREAEVSEPRLFLGATAARFSADGTTLVVARTASRSFSRFAIDCQNLAKRLSP